MSKWDRFWQVRHHQIARTSDYAAFRRHIAVSVGMSWDDHTRLHLDGYGAEGIATKLWTWGVRYFGEAPIAIE